VGSGNQIPYEPQTENKEPVILEINDCNRSIQKGKCERYMYMKPVSKHVDQPTSYPVSIAVPKHLDSDHGIITHTVIPHEITTHAVILHGITPWTVTLHGITPHTDILHGITPRVMIP
jgi:hypothetical protein